MNATPPLNDTRPRPGPRRLLRPAPLLTLATLMVCASGCGPIVRYDAAGRASTYSWRGGSHGDVRADAIEQERAALARTGTDARTEWSRRSPASDAAARRVSADSPADVATDRVRAVPAPITTRRARSERPIQITAGRRGAVPPPIDLTPSPTAEVLAATDTIRLIAAEPAEVTVGLGVVDQRAIVDRLLGVPTAPAAIEGLDLPPNARVSAWTDAAGDLLIAGRGGIIVAFGSRLPHEVDGGIVGRLRDQGWLAIRVHTVDDDPAQLAAAVTAACDELDALAATERPLVLLGCGDGIAATLGVLEFAERTPAAIVIVSDEDADTIAVQRLDRSLASVRVPVLHLRPADALAGAATVRELAVRGGLDDRGPVTTGLTGWTYARRPGPGVAWLPMLVDPVADWVARATGAELPEPAVTNDARLADVDPP